MIVKTANPMIISGKRIDPTDMYLNTEGPTAEQIKAAQNKFKPTTGGPSQSSEPSEKLKKAKLKEGKVWDATKRVWVKAQDTGLLSAIGNMFGTQPEVTSETYVDTTTSNAKQPISTTIKVLIGLGVIAAIAGIWYVTRPSKSAKTA